MNAFNYSIPARVAALATAMAFAPLANAALVSINAYTTVQGSPNQPIATPGNGISTVDLTGKAGMNNFVVNAGANQVTITEASGGAIVQGSVPGQYAAPVVNSSGTTVATPYFSTGGTPGTITMTFASVQSYLGLLWGSIAVGDNLTFKSNGATIATLTGQDAINAATGYNGANGARDFGGSQYTLVNFLNGYTFNSVVFGQSGGPSFESANFQYAARNVAAIPEPASVVLIGIGLAGLVASRRRKAARA